MTIENAMFVLQFHIYKVLSCAAKAGGLYLTTLVEQV
jgi:hypothetical protein